MSKRRDFFKWKLGAGKRGTLRRASRATGNGFEIMGACVAMLDHARASSHWSDNPEGVFKTTIEDLALDYSTNEEDVRESLGALVSKGWLYISPDVACVAPEDDISVRVRKYLEFNDPQGSVADRKAAQRVRELSLNKESEIEECDDLQGSVTTSHTCHTKSREEKRREGEEKREKEGAKAPVRQAGRDRSADIQNVFDYWVKVERETGGIGSPPNGRTPKLVKIRASKIRARLAEGYSPADLKMAIAFYARDPHHLGDTNGTRYTDLKTTLKDGAKVEAGIAGYANNTPGAGGVSRESAALLASLGHTGTAA